MQYAATAERKTLNKEKKLNTLTNVNSNANENVERQRRETEKKSESDSRTMHTEHNGKKDQNKSQKIVILGESMIKNMKVWDISKKSHSNVYVRHFLGAEVDCMKDHLKPSLSENPDHLVLYIGTNDLDSDWSPDLIAKSIVDFAPILKTDKLDVTIANIIIRNNRFIRKANEVNKCLTERCFETL